MSKIFRLGTNGTTTHQDWYDSGIFPYNQTNRDTINDPNGANAKREITSIPSPFARIDLVKNAFAEVVQSGNADGNTIFHKMVSDTLDVGEMFFNIDKFRNDIEIIVWDCNKCTGELMQSVDQGHCYVGDALSKYLESDARTYNFDRLQNIYLLNYKNGPKQMNIIGATSPATVFFSNANDLGYVSANVNFGQDRPFDGDLQPLYKRDFEYVKFWFYLRHDIGNFDKLFPEVADYLNMTFNNITDAGKRAALNDIGNAMFDVLDFSDTNQVEVLGYPLYKRTESGTFSSDFEIKPSKDVAVKPLVLPIEQGVKYSELQYKTDKWGRYNQAPCRDDEQDITKRRLPNEGSTYPYLTASDFLEDTIIKVGHKLNKDAYFDGNAILAGNKSVSYLLPLRPRFFSYFTTDDLINGSRSGQKMIEMEELGGGTGVKVTLRIPIKGRGRVDNIEYSRIYYGGDCDVKPEKNEGRVVECSFAGFIMPRIRFTDAADAIYKVGCISMYSSNYDFNFYDGDKMLPAIFPQCRNQNKEEDYKAETYTIERIIFDFIQVVDGRGNCSIMVPIFKKQRSLESFVFAVDFGTSNTHVEYADSSNAAAPRPLEYDKGNVLISNFFTQTLWTTESGKQRVEDLKSEKGVEMHDFLPEALGNGENCKFPIRTVLSYSKNTDWQMAQPPFGLANIPFDYNQREEFRYNKHTADLKWGRGNNNQAMIRAYLENLMLTIRNFILINDGDIGKTSIVWFYPISMPANRVNLMRNVWKDIAGKYFKGCNTADLTESFAPIQIFNRLATATNMVNVDIGGGTTDIAYSMNKQLNFVTSFKFAANDIFENTLLDEPRYPQNNGIIDFFKDDVIASIAKVSNELVKKASENEGMPAEMASWFFSLKDNKDVVGLNTNEVDFTSQLSNSEEFKIVFVIFYSAIIYHLSKIIRLRKLTMPRHIAFSGNGSKIINVVTNGNVDQLQQYTKLLFHMMNVDGSDGKIEILGLLGDIEPKQATCKGGILAVKAGNMSSKAETVVLKGDGSKFVSNEDTFADINETYIEKVVTEVDYFFDFILNKINKEYNFNKNFGVSNESLKIAKEICLGNYDIKTFIQKGKAICEADASGNPQPEETLFFYPIKGILSNLSESICKKFKQ